MTDAARGSAPPSTDPDAPLTPTSPERAVTAPHPDAVGLSAARALSDGSLRQYSAVEFTKGWNGVEHFVRQLRAVGFIRPSGTDPTRYAVLDLLDADGDIVGDYDVPHARAFRFIKRKLRLRVEAGDA